VTRTRIAVVALLGVSLVPVTALGSLGAVGAMIGIAIAVVEQ
jgi:hypothetical protein